MYTYKTDDSMKIKTVRHVDEENNVLTAHVNYNYIMRSLILISNSMQCYCYHFFPSLKHNAVFFQITVVVELLCAQNSDAPFRYLVGFGCR